MVWNSVSGEMTAVTWQDNSLVTVLTSLPMNPYGQSATTRKGKDYHGNNYKLTVGRPDPITVYSSTYGGVDLA